MGQYLPQRVINEERSRKAAVKDGRHPQPSKNTKEEPQPTSKTAEQQLAALVQAGDFSANFNHDLHSVLKEIFRNPQAKVSPRTLLNLRYIATMRPELFSQQQAFVLCTWAVDERGTRDCWTALDAIFTEHPQWLQSEGLKSHLFSLETDPKTHKINFAAVCSWIEELRVKLAVSEPPAEDDIAEPRAVLPQVPAETMDITSVVQNLRADFKYSGLQERLWDLLKTQETYRTHRMADCLVQVVLKQGIGGADIIMKCLFHLYSNRPNWMWHPVLEERLRDAEEKHPANVAAFKAWRREITARIFGRAEEPSLPIHAIFATQNYANAK